MRFIGCKAQLLENIKEVVDKHVLNAHVFCDAFSGTVSVARYFKKQYEIISNDMLYFSYCMQKATIELNIKPRFYRLYSISGVENPLSYFNNMPVSSMEVLPQKKRFFQNNYSPLGGRRYLTDTNALRIDFIRNTIEEWHRLNLISELEYFYLIACIVEGIPSISNISGTYGAYNKLWDPRSAKEFQMVDIPVMYNYRHNKTYNEDVATLLTHVKGDILYLDPPYNERQYLPNYHLLETAARYDSPPLKGITGMRPYEEQKSDFCSKKTVCNAFEQIMQRANFKHIILSYSTDGLMSIEEISSIMKEYGKPNTFEVHYIPYRKFKSNSCKTIQNNSKELKEMLIYIKKQV